MILLDNLVANSGLLADDERILTDEWKTFVYSWENLALRKWTNKRWKPVIQIYDSEKKQTLLAEFEVAIKDTEIRYYQKKDNETLYTYSELQAMNLDLSKYPHSDQWIYDFNKWVPWVITEIWDWFVNWVHIDKSSSVLEFLWFQIWKILDNVDLTSFSSKVTRELVDNMEWKFAKIVKSYISPNFDKLLSDTKNISIRLNKVSTMAWVVKFNLDLISWDEIAWSYEFNVM